MQLDGHLEATEIVLRHGINATKKVSVEVTMKRRDLFKLALGAAAASVLLPEVIEASGWVNPGNVFDPRDWGTLTGSLCGDDKFNDNYYTCDDVDRMMAAFGRHTCQ